MLTVYLDADPSSTTGLKHISVDWSDWLPASTSIASSTWTVENSDTSLTLSGKSNDSTTTECYVKGNQYGLNLFVKNTIVTDAATPETASRSILVKTVRMY